MWVCDEGGNAIEDIFSKSDDVTLTEWIRHSYYDDMPVSEIYFTLRRIRQRARSKCMGLKHEYRE